MIESARLAVFKEALNYLKRIVQRYEGADPQCQRSKACDALVLGDLIKQLNAKALLPLPASATVQGSFYQFYLKICAMDITSLCREHPPPPVQTRYSIISSQPADPDCVIADSISMWILRLRYTISGLDLANIPCSDAADDTN